MTPQTHFAENDGVSITYQVFGDGPGDMISITVAKGTDVYELEIRSGDRYQWLRLQHSY